ncbi:MAG: urate hydroxylase PuuD [Methyloglobulus sp.]|nr:antitermination protein NusG [Methyloglobulus sp.]
MELVTTTAGYEMLLRWGHLLAGVTWIGLLYYFNLVQGEYFKEADAAAKSDAIQKLVPRALWWFRWGAAVTLVTGLGIMGLRGGGQSLDIYIGALLGIIMFTNVWMIIWPNQKIVIASATQAANGGQALPEAAGALATAGLASRTNALFSVPMLYFMGASSHFPHGFNVFAFLLSAIIILVLEYNGAYPVLKNISFLSKLPPGGKMGPYTSVKGVIHCGLGLTVLLFCIVHFIK